MPHAIKLTHNPDSTGIVLLGAFVHCWRVFALAVAICGFAPFAQAQSAVIAMRETIVRPVSGSTTQDIQFAGYSPGGPIQNYRYAILGPDGTTQESSDWTAFSLTTAAQWIVAGYWAQANQETDANLAFSNPRDFQDVATVDPLANGSATGTITITPTSTLGLYTVKLDVRDASGNQASTSQTIQVIASALELTSEAQAAKTDPKESGAAQSKGLAKTKRPVAAGTRGAQDAGSNADAKADGQRSSQAAASGSGGFQLVIRTPKSGLQAITISDWSITPLATP